jgi:hypothetical protein
VRFLEGFADGQEVDHEERPSDLPLPDFTRYRADDLKALSRRAHGGEATACGDEIARWIGTRRPWARSSGA